MDRGIPQAGGATVLGLSVGSHTVTFSTIRGWTTPPSQAVAVSADSTATAAGVYTEPMQNQFIYTTNDGTITITGYTGSAGAVTIPSEINNLR